MTTTTIGSGYVSFASSTYIAVYAAPGSIPTLQNSGTIAAPAGYALSFAGTGTVLNAGTITGQGAAFFGAAGASLANTGTITATGAFQGIRLAAGGTVTNAASGVINGVLYGPLASGAIVLDNAGLINATYGSDSGAALEGGGTITNSGTITAALRGVDMRGGAATLTNTGSINGNVQYGVLIVGVAGLVTNTGGTITSLNRAVVMTNGANGTVANAGLIAGGTANGGRGVQLDSGGALTNAAGGTITGFYAVAAGSGSTPAIANYGSIGDAAHAIDLASGGTLTNGGLVTAPIYAGGGFSATNLLAGTIQTTAGNGMYLTGFRPTVTNAGTIVAADSNGLRLSFGASVTNASTGTITGGGGGVVVSGAAATVANQGTIAGITQYGVFLLAGGTVTNTGTAAAISGGADGVHILGDLGTIDNQGSIVGTTANGVFLAAGGTLRNAADAAVTGQQDGVAFGTGPGSVYNYGGIAGLGGVGVNLPDGGFVYNNGAGTGIYGATYGVLSAGTASLNLLNGWHIFGQTAGVSGTGSVFNGAAGVIYGHTNGVVLGAGSTLVNAGAVVGYTNAAILGTGSRLVIEPGGQFYGAGTGHGTVSGSGSTMQLAASTAGNAGIIFGVGQYFTGFGTIDVDAGANWGIVGIAAPAAITAGDGTLSLAGPLDPGVSLAFDSTGTGEVLTLSSATGSTFGNAITGVSLGDRIVLPNENFGAGATAVLNGTTLDIYDSSSARVFAFTNFAATNGAVPGAFSVGSNFVQDIACFRAGTRIATPSGPVAVEHLAIGDLVATESGPHPLRWLGHRHIDCRRHPRPADVWPIRIAPGAFAPGTPARALFLSPDHAVLVDGVLIPVRYLVNGRTIAQTPQDEVTYWHVELDRHDILRAEGLPCESYLDTGNRAAFANGGPAVHLHPDFALRIWDTQSCAPLATAGAELEAARSLLLDRAETLGHARTADPALHALAAGTPLQPETAGPRHRFHLPPGTRHLRLLSRSAVPAHLHDAATDTRRLGIAIARILLDGTPIPLADPRLGAGWHAPEAGDAWRWTAGDAALAVDSARLLEIEVAITGLYWADEAPAAGSAAA